MRVGRTEDAVKTYQQALDREPWLSTNDGFMTQKIWAETKDVNAIESWRESRKEFYKAKK